MRRKRNIQRDIAPDLKFGSVALATFINYVMERGKKSLAERIVYKTLDLISAKEKIDPMQVFEKAIEHVSPTVEVRSRRVGGASYQVPREVKGRRKTALTYRWILGVVRAKKGRPIHERLAEELIAASKNEGDAIKKKQDTHRMAEANRAFAHFGW